MALKKKISKKQALLARHAAIRLLSSMAEDDEVIAALGQSFGIQEAVAKRIVAEAWREIITADDGLDLQKKKGFLFMATREHHRRCLENKDMAQATATLRLMARLWGLDTPPKDQHDSPVTPTDEFSNRSAADLRYYAAHGHWPGEARPKKEQQQKPSDPLAGLH